MPPTLCPDFRLRRGNRSATLILTGPKILIAAVAAGIVVPGCIRAAIGRQADAPLSLKSVLALIIVCLNKQVHAVLRLTSWHLPHGSTVVPPIQQN
jgi:hypothetical protein